jgi:SAM-dependent methyltransferase
VKRRFHRERSGCEHHNRGLARFDDALRSAGWTTLSERIEGALAEGRRPKLLEIGCGEGRMLLDLLARFEGRIELHGVNHGEWPPVRDARGLRATDARYGIVGPKKLRGLPAPGVHLADAQDLSRFPLRDFDLIVSQVVLAHVARKDRVLEESARLLAPGGVFLHELDQLDPLGLDFVDADLPRFTIYDGEARTSTTTYLGQHGVEVRRGRAGREIALAGYTKSDRGLDLGLRLDPRATISLKSIGTLDPEAHLWGVRSVYRTGAARG